MSSAPATDVETIRSEIERHRADLGETVEALSAKFDGKAVGKYFSNAIREDLILRAHNAIDLVRGRFRSAGDQARHLADRIIPSKSADSSRGLGDVVAGAAIGAAIATVAYVLTRRYGWPMQRRRSRTRR